MRPSPLPAPPKLPPAAPSDLSGMGLREQQQAGHGRRMTSGQMHGSRRTSVQMEAAFSESPHGWQLTTCPPPEQSLAPMLMT
jgi:hypothetical protein